MLVRLFADQKTWETENNVQSVILTNIVGFYIGGSKFLFSNIRPCINFVPKNFLFTLKQSKAKKCQETLKKRVKMWDMAVGWQK